MQIQSTSPQKRRTIKSSVIYVPSQTDNKEVDTEQTSEEEQRHFDAVADLCFDQKFQQKQIDHAEQIQGYFLNKMPPQSHSQINLFDLGEWCIFWSYKNQSLEYYVGRYGVFYTHIDRHGIEHKIELSPTD